MQSKRISMTKFDGNQLIRLPSRHAHHNPLNLDLEPTSPTATLLVRYKHECR